MSSKGIFRISVLVSLVFLVYFLSAVTRTCDGQQTSYSSEMTFANISVSLNSLDLPMRAVNFTIFGTFDFNFNASGDLSAQMYAFDSYVGLLQLVNMTSGGNLSSYQVNSSQSSFSRFFEGGPEAYPFDQYQFNITLEFGFSGVSIRDNTTTANWRSMWPLRVQYEGPSDQTLSITQIPAGLEKAPRISMSCTLNRPQWQGYATLLPIFLMFALMGFIPLLKTEAQEMTYRLSVCLAVLTSAIAYSFSVQSTLPPGRYYLSIPEALVYTVIGSLTIFIIFTIISHRMVTGSLGRVFVDLTAIVSSIALLAFTFWTFYTNRIVSIFPYTYYGIFRTEWTIVAFLLAGVFILAFWKLHKLHEIPISYADALNTWLYVMGYSLGAYWLFVLSYTNWALAGSVLSTDLIPHLTLILFFAILTLVVYALKRWAYKRKLETSLFNYPPYIVSSFIFVGTLGNLILLLTPTLNQVFLWFVQTVLFIGVSVILVLIRKNSKPRALAEQVQTLQKIVERLDAIQKAKDEMKSRLKFDEKRRVLKD
jgi:hypothetical protein